VRECSPPLPLIEITAACMAASAWITLVVAAAMPAMLEAAAWGIRTTSRTAPGAIACTISVSSTSSLPAR